MSTITELDPRRLALTNAVARVPLDLDAQRVMVEGDPADAVGSLTARITQILQED